MNVTSVESPYWQHNPGSRERLPGRAAGMRPLTVRSSSIRRAAPGETPMKRLNTRLSRAQLSTLGDLAIAPWRGFVEVVAQVRDELRVGGMIR